MYHGDGPSLTAGLGLLIYGLAAATFFCIGLTLGDGLVAAVVAQAVGFVAIPLGTLYVHGIDRRELGLTRPPLLAMLGAVVIGASVWLIALRLAVPVVTATGREAATRALSHRLLAPSLPLSAVLLVHAVIPGFCEELVHRGMLLGALVPRWGRVAAIALTTLLFAVIHGEPARMVATALLGVLAGTVTVWARSVWPAVALHITNNTVALTIASGLTPALANKINIYPTAALLAASGLTCGGLLLAWRGRTQPQRARSSK